MPIKIGRGQQPEWPAKPEGIIRAPRPSDAFAQPFEQSMAAAPKDPLGYVLQLLMQQGSPGVTQTGMPGRAPGRGIRPRISGRDEGGILGTGSDPNELMSMDAALGQLAQWFSRGSVDRRTPKLQRSKPDPVEMQNLIDFARKYLGR